jgi:sec-independent protein translocase protein TatA
MFGNLGWQELLIILVVVLLLFGARRLPEIGSSLGQAMREFKRSISGLHEEEDREKGTGPSDKPVG